MSLEHAPDFKDIDVAKTTKVKALQSHVREEKPRGRGIVTVGHVLMLDIEDSSFFEVYKAVRDKLDLFFIFKSSDNNYHLISPVVRSIAENRRIMNSIELQDSKHTSVGLEKDCWALRVTEKGHKPKPELLHVNYTPEDDVLVSKPHLEALDVIHEAEGFEKYKNGLTCVGDTLKIVEYHTRINNH